MALLQTSRMQQMRMLINIRRNVLGKWNVQEENGFVTPVNGQNIIVHI